jgi:CHASE3 domain sensor protein
MSKANERIVKDGLMKEFEGKFLEKGRDYNDGHEFLGVRGQFSDMNRKFQKLKRFMWDNPEEQPVGESLEEILFDMIGHCFLTIDLLRQDAADKVLSSEGHSDAYRAFAEKVRRIVQDGEGNENLLLGRINGLVNTMEQQGWLA